MKLLSHIDLDKIMPKIQNNENKLKPKIVTSHKSVKISDLQMGNFLEMYCKCRFFITKNKKNIIQILAH